MFNDTIAAIITPPGIGAVGALRLSGRRAFDAASKVFRSKSGKCIDDLSSYSLTYGGIYIIDEFLDQALMLKMGAPNSFTGEDVVELQCHGGPVVMSRLLDALTDLPGLSVRPAGPGEFSMRAFINGKIDLSRAEAIMELVGADNPKAALMAADQLEGGLFRRISSLKDGIVGLLAEIEADVDFPDEGLDSIGGTASRAMAAKALMGETNDLLATAERGRIYRDGIKVVFYGRPNAGKSSLLNAMLKEPRAIVTPEPGTTRDILEERILLKGVPLILTDTAGVRVALGLAEQAGVERARQTAAKADLILYIVDIMEGITSEDEAALAALDRDKTLIVFNKTDLAGEQAQSLSHDISQWSCCSLCALDPKSTDVLAGHIQSFFEKGDRFAPNKDVMLNSRQGEALLRSRQALASAVDAYRENVPEDIVAIDLKLAWSALGELTGESLQSAIIEEIFSTFCLGK